MKIQLAIKRVADILFAFCGLLVLSPLLIIIGIAITADSRGPIIFKQDRIGKNGRHFHIYKFRTMVDGAQKIGRGIFINRNDFRITRVGRFLRKTSLDELPQLINILKGEMSFVGPRPPLINHPYNFASYPNEQKKRFRMLPGITGYAQVMGRNKLSWEQRFEYDLYYIEHFNLLLDLKIVLKTIYKVGKKEGVYGRKGSKTGS